MDDYNKAIVTRDVDEIRRLLESEATIVRWELYHNPASPPDVIDALSRDPSASIRVDVVKDRRTSIETLAYMAQFDPDALIRKYALSRLDVMDILGGS